MYYWIACIYGNWSHRQNQQLGTSSAVHEGRFMQAAEQQGIELSWLAADRASYLASLSYCSKLHHLQMALGDFSGRGEVLVPFFKQENRTESTLCELLPCLQTSSCFRDSTHLQREAGHTDALQSHGMGSEVAKHREFHSPCKMQCQFVSPAHRSCSTQNCLMPGGCKAVSVIFAGEERAPCKLWWVRQY